MPAQNLFELGFNVPQFTDESNKIKASIEAVLKVGRELNGLSLTFGDYTQGIGNFKKATDEAAKVLTTLKQNTENLTKVLVDQEKVKQARLKTQQAEIALENEVIKQIALETAAETKLADAKEKSAQASKKKSDADKQIPFTTNIGPGGNIVEPPQGKQTGTLVSEQELKLTQEQLAAQAELNAQKTETVKITEKASAAVGESVTALDKYVGTIKQNLSLQEENNAALRQNKTEQDQLNKTIAASSGATKAQQSALLKLKEEELQLKNIGQQLNVTIKQQVRELQSTGGSINEMRARVSALQKAYAELSAKERESPFGKDILKQLEALNPALVKAEASIGQFNREVGHYEKAIEGVTHGVKEVLGALGVVSAAYSGVEFIKSSLEAYNEEETALIKLKNILHNLGREDAFEHLEHQLHSLSEEFQTVKEVDLVNTFQQLITYGKLTEEQISKLIPVIINLQALRPDRSFQETTGILIKSLEGNNRGLKEYGINIRDAKNTSEAFSLVMKELAPRVDGVAKAFGEGTQGQIKKTEADIEHLKVEIGEKLAPVMKGFYEVVSQAISGIPEIFSSMRENLDANVASIKRTFGDVYVFLSTGYAGLSQRLAQRREEEEKARQQEALLAAEERAHAYAESLHGKSLKELTTEYKKQEAIWEVSKRKVLELAAAHKLNTEEGRKELAYLHEDKAVLTEINKLIEEGVKGKEHKDEVLGFGDPTKPFKSGSEGSKKDQVFEDNKAILQDDISTNEKIAQSEYGLEKFRIESAQRVHDLQIQLIDLEQKHGETSAVQAGIARKNAEEKLNEDLKVIYADRYKLQQKTTEPIQTPQEYNDAALKRLEDLHKKGLIEEKEFQQQFNEIQNDIFETLPQAQQDKILLERHKKAQEDLLKAIEAGGQDQFNIIASNAAKEEKLLNEKYAQGLINEEDYQHELAKIQTKASAENLAEAIRIAKAKQAQLDKFADGNKFDELSTKIDTSEAALAKLGYRFDEATGKLVKFADTSKDLGTLVKNLDFASQATQELIGLTQELLTAGYEKELNAIQHIEDAENERYATEQKNIENSTLSEQEKANRTTVLQAEQAQREKAFAAEKRKIQVKEARVAKLAQEANIIATTATAVIGALAPPPVGLGPVAGIPLAIKVGIIGAIQLAKVIATPIPEYRYGVAHSPEGPAITDEAGPEFYIEPDGHMYFGEDKPNVKNLKAGTRIIPAHDTDKINEIIYDSMMKNTANFILQIPQDKKDEAEAWAIAKFIVSGFSRNKPSVVVNNNLGKDLRFQKYLNDKVRRKP